MALFTFTLLHYEVQVCISLNHLASVLIIIKAFLISSHPFRIIMLAGTRIWNIIHEVNSGVSIMRVNMHRSCYCATPCLLIVLYVVFPLVCLLASCCMFKPKTNKHFYFFPQMCVLVVFSVLEMKHHTEHCSSFKMFLNIKIQENICTCAIIGRE